MNDQFSIDKIKSKTKGMVEIINETPLQNVVI